MAEAEKTKLRLEIAHVLFIDIVGYSKLRINDQSEQIQKLREIVRGTDQFRSTEAEGKLQRAKLSSTQLPTYYVGTSEWWKLRHAYETAKGKDFTLAEFHDRALDQGALPVPWLENILLPK